MHLQLVITELLHHSPAAHTVTTLQQDHNRNISEQLLGNTPDNQIESVSEHQPWTQDRCLRRRLRSHSRSLTAPFPSSVSIFPSSVRLCRNRTREKCNIRKNMTAQVLSIPRDYTDNKGKDESSFTLNGPSVSVSYHTEVARLDSFRNWTIPFISKAELARYGFYYVGPNDMVKCYFCRVEIGLWEPNDNVLSEHLRWSPYCPLLRKRQTNNVPIDASFLDLLPEPSYDTCGIRIRENSVAENAYSSSDRSSSGSLSSPPSSLTSESSMLSNGPITQLAPPELPQQKLPEYPNYAIEAKRLESYEDWPKFMKQKPKELSDAGFFYTGKSDRVKCFSCGGGLKDWEAEDQPWEQHAMWYSKCEYLKLMKGEEYIAECLAKKESPSDQNGSDVGPSNSPQPSTSGVASAATTSLPSSQSSSLSASTEEVHCPNGGSSSSGMEEDEDEPNRKLDTSRTCKICYVNEYNTAFSPCGHVVACAKCASSVTKCPLCRKPFTNVMRIYLM